MKFLGWYENHDHLHIAMEYIKHGDLRNYMKVERSENEAKEVIRQLLEGMVVMHQGRFAHRDLKPEVRCSLHHDANGRLKGDRTSLWSRNLPYGSRLEILG